MTDNNMFTSKRQIAKFFKTSVNKIDLLISLGAPILKITPPHSTQAIYRAYLPALEQWMGYRRELDGLPDQACQQTPGVLQAGQA
jgi:hypothetical protein